MKKFTSTIIIFVIAQILTAHVCFANDSAPANDNDNGNGNDNPVLIIAGDDVVANLVNENSDPVNGESTDTITLEEDVIAHQVEEGGEGVVMFTNDVIAHQAFQFVVFLPVVTN